MMEFTAWMKQFQKEDSAIGDLARDMKEDSRFPKTNNKEVIEMYMLRVGSAAAYKVCVEAWNRYEKDRRNEHATI